MTISFVDLVALKKIDRTTYQSIARPFVPGEGHERAHNGTTYGGHVYAQAAWAAAQTVLDGFMIHNITGNFILGGSSNVPFIYEVEILRNGRSYCTRAVKVTQVANKICFHCVCSFKKEEANDLDAQAQVNLWQKYELSLRGKTPEDFLTSPNMDVPWYWKWRAETGVEEPFPGLEARKADMTAYNKSRTALDKRQLNFYKPVGDMHSDVNLHLCAHLYASDRNSLFAVANHFDVAEYYSHMGSLSHTVIFHSSARSLTFGRTETSGQQGDWFCKEDWTDRIADGRGMFHSRVWSPEGTHVATIMQEGMIRLGEKSRASSKI